MPLHFRNNLANVLENYRLEFAAENDHRLYKIIESDSDECDKFCQNVPEFIRSCILYSMNEKKILVLFILFLNEDFPGNGN